MKHTKDKHQKLLNLIKETGKSAKAVLEPANLYQELITDNSEKISNQDFQMEEMNNQITNLTAILINELKSEVDDINSRGLRKTLIFRNIPQTKNKESWDKTKLTLAKEMKVTTPDIGNNIIISKSGRVHRAPQRNANHIPPLNYYQSLPNSQIGTYWNR